MRASLPAVIAALSIAAPASAQDTLRAPREISLPTVTVLSDYAKLKRDSALRRVIYRKEIKDATSKVRIPWKEMKEGRVKGFAVDGVFSELALRLSGKKKRYQRFLATMEADDEVRFAAVRYTPAIVSRVTGLPDSGARLFIARHPMPRAFAESAGELEFLQWIRDRQREAR